MKIAKIDSQGHLTILFSEKIFLTKFVKQRILK